MSWIVAQTMARQLISVVKVVLQKRTGPTMAVQPHFLFSLGRYFKEAGDERHLPQEVSSFHTTHLPLPHHVHALISL
jgi:hypothetical protein